MPYSPASPVGLLLLPLLLLIPAAAFVPAASSIRPISAPAPLLHRCIKAPPAAAAESSTSPAAADDGPSYWEWLGRQVELKLRPKPYQGLRLQLEQDLAVLLMRSSYQVADDLDFVGMDTFQKEQFLFRQAEWEGGWSRD